MLQMKILKQAVVTGKKIEKHLKGKTHKGHIFKECNLEIKKDWTMLTGQVCSMTGGSLLGNAHVSEAIYREARNNQWWQGQLQKLNPNPWLWYFVSSYS